MLPSTPYLEENPKIKKSLYYSVVDGIFYSIKIGIGTNSISPYAVFLKASDFHIGLLGTLPMVLGSILQLFSHRLIVWFHSRKFVVTLGVFIQAIMFLPILLIYFCNPSNRVDYLLFWATMYWVFGMVINPAWNSWMGDLVPDEIRGAYFGKRSKVMEIAVFSATLVGGGIVKLYENEWGNVYLGFAIVFSLACLARLISAYFLTLKFEPDYTPSHRSEADFFIFLKKLPHSNYGLFVSFMCLMNFSCYLSSPYTAPFLLNDVQVSYFNYYMIIAVATITKCMVLPYWGQICDEFGTHKVLMVSGLLMPLTPILWFFHGPVWYFILAQMYAGFVWAGFELSTFNIIFDITDRENRLKYISYYNVINGIAIFLGGLVGSYCRNLGISYTIIFVMSGLLRYLVYFNFIGKIHEVRNVQVISSPQLLVKLFSKMKPQPPPKNAA